MKFWQIASHAHVLAAGSTSAGRKGTTRVQLSDQVSSLQAAQNRWRMEEGENRKRVRRREDEAG